LAGAGKGMFTTVDNYVISINEKASGPKVGMVILAAVFAVYVAFQ